MGDALFAISNFPINKLTLDVICQYVAGHTPDITNGLDPQGTASVSISTYDAPQGKLLDAERSDKILAQLGFTLQGQVTVTPGTGDIWKALKYLSADPSRLTYGFFFNIALFGPNPAQLELKFTESGM